MKCAAASSKARRIERGKKTKTKKGGVGPREVVGVGGCVIKGQGCLGYLRERDWLI